MQYATKIWQDKEGSNYLIFHTRTTHTGTHNDMTWTDDIEKATVGRYLPLPQEIRAMVVPIPVIVTTTVTVIRG